MADFKNRNGEEYTSKEGCKLKIIDYIDCGNCTIQFEDGTILEKISFGNIKDGRVKNPFHPSIYGVGYIGQGKYRTQYDKIPNLCYGVWVGILKRCYDLNYQEKRPSYKGCTIDEKWHNFQNFAQWCEENFVKDSDIDKDILIKGNKIYSAKTCCFVPNDINMLLVKSPKTRGEYPIGVTNRGKKYIARIKINKVTTYLGAFDTPEEAFECYKFHKEKCIKEAAEKWKLKITEPCYQALINYQVEITD